jgi:hypothetical protein
VSNATCVSVLDAGSGTRVFGWTNSAIAPSTLSYNRTVSRICGNIVVAAEGSIVSGTQRNQWAWVQPDPVACMTAGVPQRMAAGTLTIGIGTACCLSSAHRVGNTSQRNVSTSDPVR